MDLIKELWLKRYEITAKVTENCRVREFTMINFTIVIFTASVWFIRQLKSPWYQFFGIILLVIIIALIGLYIAKLKSIEQMHHHVEKNIYTRASMTTYDHIMNEHRKGFNRIILILIYIVLIFSLFSFASIILYKNVPLCSFLLYIFVGLLLLFLYCLYFWNTITISKEIMNRIIDSDKDIKIG